MLFGPFGRGPLARLRRKGYYCAVMNFKWTAAVLVLAAIGILLIRPLDWPRYRRLQERGVGADGWVTALDAGRRPIVYYSYLAGEKVYSGVWRSPYLAPEPGELSAGDRVIVFYLPDKPGESCLGDPKELIKAQHRVILWCLLVFLPVASWILARELRKASE